MSAVYKCIIEVKQKLLPLHIILEREIHSVDQNDWGGGGGGIFVCIKKSEPPFI